MARRCHSIRLAVLSPRAYAYVGNPMQLPPPCCCSSRIVLNNAWVSAAGIMAHIYSAGLAGWDEDDDRASDSGAHGPSIAATFHAGSRMRPWHRADGPPAQLFVAESCDMCREVAHCSSAAASGSLRIVPAETHPSARCGVSPTSRVQCQRLRRRGDRPRLEHIHLGWAAVGFLLRLPIVRPLAQLLADASGAGPRTIPARAPQRDSFNAKDTKDRALTLKASTVTRREIRP